MSTILHLDVRGLPPPEPFMNIMQALQDLPAAGTLQVRIHREPYLLYEALREQGYSWRTSALAEGDFLIEITHTA